MAISKIQKISKKELTRIEKVIGESFVTNELFHNWGTIEERRSSVLAYMKIYVDCVYRAGELYGNETLTGFVGIEDTRRPATAAKINMLFKMIFMLPISKIKSLMHFIKQIQSSNAEYAKEPHLDILLVCVDGSNLLINTYAYNDNGRMKTISPFKEGVTEIVMVNAADEKQTIRVGGILDQEDLKEQGFHEMNPYPVRMVVPDIDARYFDWFCTPDDEQAYTEFARKIMDEYYPILTEDSYVEQGYTVRIARVDTMVKMLNIAIVLAEIVLYGFVILLIFMGFTSVVSTLATNIRIRSREFAILKSVGMTNASLRKMIYCESIICMIKAFIPGITFGIAIPFVINLSIRKAFPVLYSIPWGILVVGIAALFVIVILITCLEMNKLKDKSIIDEIRMDVM